jgi:hypothetical protein
MAIIVEPFAWLLMITLRRAKRKASLEDQVFEEKDLPYQRSSGGLEELAHIRVICRLAHGL